MEFEVWGVGLELIRYDFQQFLPGELLLLATLAMAG